MAAAPDSVSIKERSSIKERLGQDRPLLCSWLLMPGHFQAGRFADAGRDIGC